MIITIDGPVASGKSSLARKIANELHIYYLNSGLLYRGLAFILINQFSYDDDKLKNPDFNDIKDILNGAKFIYLYNQKESLTYDNIDITKFLKTPHIDEAASILSADKQVRLALLDFQRNFAAQNDLVVDGRDCGSVVFPNADIKIFLTAFIAVRALRWQQDMQLKGLQYSLTECEQIITERDKRDQEREIAPLVVPNDAIILDNSNLNQDETFQKVLEITQTLISDK
jgi:cytidylate kinase